MDFTGLSILALPCLSPLSFLLHSNLKGMILDAPKSCLPCFAFLLVG